MTSRVSEDREKNNAFTNTPFNFNSIQIKKNNPADQSYFSSPADHDWSWLMEHTCTLTLTSTLTSIGFLKDGVVIESMWYKWTSYPATGSDPGFFLLGGVLSLPG